ncbi:hypothetical protein P8452_24862 [Trifolium repens]|nr:hypothetical protein P8452_24862 [Trifolium repens]
MVMMNKTWFGFFFILLILFVYEMVVQTEGWSCDDTKCMQDCIARGYRFGGGCFVHPIGKDGVYFRIDCTCKLNNHH